MTRKVQKVSLKDENILSLVDESYKEIVISSKNKLKLFLIDILDLENNGHPDTTLKADGSYKILFSLLDKMLPFTIVVEERYVDRTYRDSYYMHFSCKHEQYNRFCKRLFLFKDDIFSENEDKHFADLEAEKLQERFVGTIVIRPLMQGKIGRSLINPYFVLDKENTYIRSAKYAATICGMRFYVNAFPFSMQDGETTSCAETTILNLMDYFSKKYSEYKNILPSEIIRIVEKNHYERALPSRGLKYPIISKIFSEIGFYPRMYDRNVLTDISSFKRTIHYYIESGIPVGLGTKLDEKTKHSVICIGHGKINYDEIGQKLYAVYGYSPNHYIWLVDSADLCNSYVIMDDQHPPYEVAEWHTHVSSDVLQKIDNCMLGSYEPETLIVPLYKRMFMEAQQAYDICTSILANEGFGIRRFDRKLGSKNNPVIIRLFLCSSKNFKRQRINHFSSENREVRDRYSVLQMPRFVWVCEIYDAYGYRNKLARGEIVIDATASPHDGLKSALLFHYPSHILICQQNIRNTAKTFGENREFENLGSWAPFQSYDHNLFSPERIYINDE